MIELRRIARRLDLSAALGAALDVLARGNIASAITALADLDDLLAAAGIPSALRARARILTISQALSQHAAYFETGAAR